jgi:hypothetical protein
MAKEPELPKLIARVRRHGAGRRGLLWSTAQASSVAEAGGGAARHTRARSVDAPAVVAGCRRLRFVPLSCQMQRSATVNEGL